MIILGDFRKRAGVTSHGCYQSLVYQVRRYIYTQSGDIHVHSSRFPSMALLSLCIKPLSPITLTPRQSHLSRIPPPATSSSFAISSLPFQPLLLPVVADRGVSLAREYFRQDVSQNLYRPKGCDGREGESSRSGRRWRRPGWFSRRVSPVTFHYRLITSEYSFRVSPCLLANP